MSFQKLQVVNFGRSRAFATGSTGVGYTVYDAADGVTSPRSTAGVYEILSGSGNYAAFVTFPDSFHGSILWDTGAAFPTASYAAEEFNVEANNPNVDATLAAVQSITGSIQLLRDLNEGRWKIVSNQMLFYAADNTTLVATFNLFDDLGVPSMDAVFERVRVP